jgi:fumarylacetoacetase
MPVDEAERHIFGLCMVSDWSARDVQAWESQPLGPFLSKNFATTISSWVITWEALQPFRCPALVRAADDPRPLPYLTSPANEATGGFDVTVEVRLCSDAMGRRGDPAVMLSRSSLRDLYWTLAQMVAHHTSNGCNLRPGDLMASGTISRPGDGSVPSRDDPRRGVPHSLPNGEKRAFLADGDEVIMRTLCERAGYVRIGFGDCRGVVPGANTEKSTAKQERASEG